MGHILSYRFLTSDVVDEWACDLVAVCTGLHVVPDIPLIKGIEASQKSSIHLSSRSEVGLELGKMC
jgi:dimethylaniline monooxygenase (N-oxide forming)